MVVVLLTCFGALLMASLIQYGFQWSAFRTNFKEDLATLAEIVANSSTAAVDFEDAASAGEVLRSWTRY